MYNPFKDALHNSLRTVAARTWAGVAALVVVPAWAQTPASLTPCRIPGVAQEVRCGVVQRPLDASRPKGTQIDIHYAVLPAVARRKRDDAVFFIAGGPGQSAIDLMPHVLPLFSRLNQRRDIVFVDQRGTGRSVPLRCDPPKVSTLASWAQSSDLAQSIQDAQDCLKKLNALPWVTHPSDIGQFTTPQAMQDMNAVREQLGARTINLVAASYGTRAALDYQRQFPQTVRRLVLDGVVPPNMALHNSSGADAQAALEAVWTACNTEPVCQKRFGDLRATWQQLLQSLPRDQLVNDPRTGQSEVLTITRDMVLAAVRAPLYAPSLAAALPQALQDASSGRWEGLAALASATAPRNSPPLYTGMHLTVVCAEDVKRAVSSPNTAGSNTDFGDALSQRYTAICPLWPTADVPPAFYQLKPSSAAVLLLSGGVDPVTPPRHAKQVAQALGNKVTQVVVPQASHGLMGLPCVPDLVFRYLDTPDGQMPQVDGSCLQALPRPLSFSLPAGTP
jgi:pimeloyl-ACP methyl ester carboxylesterase